MDPIGATTSTISMTNGPEEEQLSTDLSLFMSNMQKVDFNRKEQIKAATVTENAKTERFTLELQSEGTDFHTVFKNQLIVVNSSNDLFVHSVVANLAIRGFSLREQVISFFSEKSNCFIAAGKHPIPADAVIPAAELQKNKRLSLKIWPAVKLPETLLLELDSHAKSKAKTAFSTPLNATQRVQSSEVDTGSRSEKGPLVSFSSATSYGKELIHENTIE